MSNDPLSKTLASSEVREKIDKLSAPYKKLMAYYKCAMMEVSTKFNVLNEALSLQYDRNPIESIKTRIKSPESIMDKLARKNLQLTLENIEKFIADIAGIRVICSFPSDIYMLADCLLSQDDIILIEKKDYIKTPKKNGYRSLHLIIGIPIFLHDQKKIMNGKFSSGQFLWTGGQVWNIKSSIKKTLITHRKLRNSFLRAHRWVLT